MYRTELIETLELLASGLRVLEDFDKEKLRIEVKLRCELYKAVKSKVPTKSEISDMSLGHIERVYKEAQKQLWDKVECTDILKGVGDAFTRGIVSEAEVREWCGDPKVI